MFGSCLFRLLALPLAMLMLLAGYEAIRVLDARDRTPAALASVASRPVKLAVLTPERRQMLLTIEDPGFYQHHGYDFSTPGAGATTITQGIVKRLYFPKGFKQGFAKIELVLIAWLVFDPVVPKDVQLEIALNYTYFGTVDGRAVVGFEDAAQTYYGLALADLSDRQFLGLVAMMIAPDALDPLRHAEDNADRVNRIEALLAGRCEPANAFDVRYAACDLPLPSPSETPGDAP